MNPRQNTSCGDYSFVKAPKDLFRMPEYVQVSAPAKLLYGFLLDRSNLSDANGEAWKDKSGRHFVYYPIKEIMERFRCGHDKAAALLRELEQVQLITRTLQGRGKPYRIVVQPFTKRAEKKRPTVTENRTVDLELSDINKNERNNTDTNKTDSIISLERKHVEREMKGHLCYQVLLEHIPKDRLDGILNVIVDTICTSDPIVKIAGATIPREEVRQRFLALDEMDIYYVNDQLERETCEIHSLRGYILARLYEAKQLRDTFYGRWVLGR